MQTIIITITNFNSIQYAIFPRTYKIKVNSCYGVSYFVDYGFGMCAVDTMLSRVIV